jgi:hypothetical protein
MAGKPIVCPFVPCQAPLTTVPERQRHDPHPLHRIPPHETMGREWFGQCPASLMAYPVDRLGRNALQQQEQVLLNIENQRDIDATASDAEQHDRPPVEADRRPHPDREPPFMFRPGPGSDPKVTGPRAFPRLPVEYLPGTDMGGSMASVAEVRAAIDQANALIAEAQAQAQATSGKLAEARTLINWIRQTTVDPLGLPQVSSAVEKADEIGQLCNLAIEANTTYGGTL